MPKNRYEYFVGIDPGVTGAIAIIAIDGKVVYIEDCPTIKVKGYKKITDACRLAKMMREIKNKYKRLYVAIEEPIAMPNNGRKMGSISMLSFGRNFGIWEGIVSSLGIDYITVHPSVWKRAIFNGKQADKSSAIKMSIELFPDSKKYLTHKSHHGRAEAVLLSVYAMNSMVTLTKESKLLPQKQLLK